MLDLFAASECVLVLTHGVIVQTDVDCGASCPACELGRSCLVQEDCASPNLCNLGVCCLRTGKANAALRHLQHAIELLSESAGVFQCRPDAPAAFVQLAQPQLAVNGALGIRHRHQLRVPSRKIHPWHPVARVERQERVRLASRERARFPSRTSQLLQLRAAPRVRVQGARQQLVPAPSSKSERDVGVSAVVSEGAERSGGG